MPGRHGLQDGEGLGVEVVRLASMRHRSMGRRNELRSTSKKRSDRMDSEGFNNWFITLLQKPCLTSAQPAEFQSVLGPSGRRTPRASFDVSILDTPCASSKSKRSCESLAQVLDTTWTLVVVWCLTSSRGRCPELRSAPLCSTLSGREGANRGEGLSHKE